MASHTMALGPLRASHVRLWTPWNGRWVLDVDIDLDKSKAVPTGKQTLTIGTATLAGTVDDSRSGRFGETASVRLFAGAGGWHKSIAARSFHNDAGLKSTDVLSATAAEVGETIDDQEPVTLGVDYERAAGPAADVLAERSWFVDFDGKTIAGERPAATAPKSAEVLSWSGLEQRAELACDELLVPGTTITDARFGTIVLRDIEQTFADGSARAVAWCGPVGVTRLVDSLLTLVRHRLGTAYLAKYAYRVVKQNVDRRLVLQAVENVRGLPDMLPISPTPGVAGVTAKLREGSIVFVAFIAGDRTRPVVTSFEGSPAPYETTIAADVVNIGGEGATALALAEKVAAELAKIKNAFNGHIHVATSLGSPTGGPLGPFTPPDPPSPARMYDPGDVAAEKAKGV